MAVMNRSLLFVFSLFLLNACGQPQQGTQSSAVSEIQEPAYDTTPPPAGPQFYKRYSGTLGGEPIVLHLVRYGNSVEGIYYFRSGSPGIRLRNLEDSLDDASHFVLDETGREPLLLQHGDDTRWNLTMNGDAATGVWHSKHGTDTRSISLREDYPEGSVRLNAFFFADSSALHPGSLHTPQAKSSFGYLVPATARNGFLYGALKEQLLPERLHDPAPMPELVKEAQQAYFDNYRKENANLKLEGKNALEALSFSYSDERAVYVHYNDDDWLVTELFNASYTGGAHGFDASSFANIDLAQKRVWQLADIITDSNALRPMLDDAAISYFNVTPGQPLEQRLLVDDIPATDNVHVGPKGLSFVYVPYEIAPYAEGQISLYIPYSKLYPLLTPAFRERMKMGARSGTAFLSSPHSTTRYAKSRRAGHAALPHRPLHAAGRF
jgi:hypothetical protein